MRKFIFTIIAIVAILICSANTKTTLEGNTFKVEKTVKEKESSATETGYFIEVKGVKYPILKSKRGSYYYMKTSKKGNQYKAYIKDSTIIIKLNKQ